MEDGNGSGNSPGNSNSPGAHLARVWDKRSWPPPLPKRLAAFQDDYEAFCHDCLAELGGATEATVKEIALLESTAEIRVLRRKCGRNLLNRGLAKRNGDLRGPFKVYVALVNSERQALIALGLKRRMKSIPTLRGYLEGRQQSLEGQPAAAESTDGKTETA